MPTLGNNVSAAARVAATGREAAHVAATGREAVANAHDGGDAVDLLGIDHIEFWVGNANQAAHFYCAVLGFTRVAYAGPETGIRTHVSHVLAQGGIHFVVTGGLDPDGDIADHVRRHGDGVKRVAFCVHDAAVARERAVAAGASPRGVVHEHFDAEGTVRHACIDALGDVEYAFVSRHDHHGAWMGGFERVEVVGGAGLAEVGLTSVDHIVANTPAGTLGQWVQWHEAVLGLRPMAEFSADVSTERTALSSTVLANRTGTVTLPINEPAPSRHRSQISEFLDAWGGAGIQHLALATDDIVAAVAELRARGLAFLSADGDYHDRARARMGDIGIDWDEVRRQDVMVDRDDRGHLLQIFTQPLQDRPTLFFEIIQRQGAVGFGVGNFGALFASMERSQEARGNL